MTTDACDTKTSPKLSRPATGVYNSTILSSGFYLELPRDSKTYKIHFSDIDCLIKSILMNIISDFKAGRLIDNYNRLRMDIPSLMDLLNKRYRLGDKVFSSVGDLMEHAMFHEGYLMHDWYKIYPRTLTHNAFRILDSQLMQPAPQISSVTPNALIVLDTAELRPNISVDVYQYLSKGVNTHDDHSAVVIKMKSHFENDVKLVICSNTWRIDRLFNRLQENDPPHMRLIISKDSSLDSKHKLLLTIDMGETEVKL